ncbi:RHS repeat-associated core domain-containing protein [Chryseobacterium sp. JJR-5R]|uniref:RHS repeat-associated core domain-containing protein n=1 Tax=Chryseobacterium sp. JJR-5R TaxID=3093923 RepID=UPI002A7485D4|nr:RHS repeat-associated core domain-containing protein [Chryseobacterium sp. JJR-5R]WPO81910.1 RHS repeat-associated core domain-containing protein [Chryseobacterium sp. JJR-5R]
MRKRILFNIKYIDLLPVFIPIILSLCSWTMYKVMHKDTEKGPSVSQYSNPFKINCDFLKPVYNSTIQKRYGSTLETSTLPIDSKSATIIDNDKIRNTTLSARPVNLFFNDKALVNSGYIGEIGDRDAKQWDSDPSDNIFNIPLSNVNKIGSYKLSYDIDGYSDINSVTRSINGSYAIGGYIKEKNSGWTEVSEEIDPAILKEGNNFVLFNALNKGDYYTIKNVRITENKVKNIKPYKIVSKIYKDKVFYIRGFIDSPSIESIEIGEQNIKMHGNEFEFLSLAENKKEISIKFTNKDKSTYEELISKDNQKPFSEINSYKELNNNIVYRSETGIVLGLRNIDLPPIEQSISNVSADYYGFRFKGKATEETIVHLPYDETKLPNSYTENDITAFKFDYTKKSWVSIAVDSINTKKKYVVFKTLFGNTTDYINGVMKQPESPENSASAPTALNDAPIANPASKINMISPPSANQQGSAVVQYPIEIPKGISGLQPSISVTYNSDNKSGWAGTGWDISVGTIEIDTRWGVPVFDPTKESEIYTIGGEQLVFKDNYLPNKIQIQENRSNSDTRFYYRTGVTEGLYITRKGNTPSSYTWEILDRDGIKKEYNEVLTDNSSSNSTGNRIRWYLTKVTDRYNNTIVYQYTDSFEGGGKGKYLSRIAYSNNTFVTFENEPGVRADRTFSYKSGVKLTDAKILNKIAVYRANIKIREYQFINTTAGQFNKRLLTAIIQKDGSGNEFNRHKFSYKTARIFEDQPQTYNTGTDVGNVGPFNGANPSAINGDFSDNINKIRGSLNIGSGAGCFFVSFNKKNTVGFNMSYSENKTYGKSQLMDIDGNGLPDKVFYGGNGNLWFRKNYGSGFGGVNSSVNWPTGTPLSKTSSYIGSAGLEFVYKNYAAGANVNWSNNNTPVYFSDVNGDGLADLISYGDVYYSRIRNGVPEFESQKDNEPNVTETTPNVILNGAPAVQIIEPGQTGPQLLGNIVRMWEAPVSGRIIVHANATLEQQSVDGVDFWLELGAMTKANEDNPSYVPANSAVIGSPVTLTIPGQQVSIHETVEVQKGQRIFVVASAKENPIKDKIVSEVGIAYIVDNSIDTAKDANGNFYYHFNAPNSYLASSKKGNPLGEKAHVNISWANMGSQYFTDDVDFKIYKIVVPKSDTTGVIQPSSSNLIYHHKLIKGNSLSTLTPAGNLISGVDISDILVNQAVSDSTITILNFDVSSDTNVSWEKIKWKPKMEVTTETEVQQINALVEYHPYGERLSDNLPKNFSKYSQYSECRFLLYPKFTSSPYQPLTINLPTLHNTTVTFSLKMKDGSGNIAYLLKNKVNVVDNVMEIPKFNFCDIFGVTGIPGIPYSQLWQHLFYFEITSSDYEVTKKLAELDPYIYNYNYESQGPTSGSGPLANTEHKADYFAARSGNVHYNVNTGLVYQGWGGFSYNGSKYKGQTIREGEFNSSLSGFNMSLLNPTLPCSGDPNSQAYQDCVFNYVSQMMNSRYFTPIDLKTDAETYTSPLESAEIDQYHMQPALLGTYTDPDSESQYPGYSVPSPRGIIKYYKGNGFNVYGSAFIVGGNAGSSRDYTKDHFVDFNGDRYPDVVSSHSIQQTNLLGQLSIPANTFEREMYNTTTNYGLSLGLPVPTKFSNTANGGFQTGGEKNTQTTTSANAVGIGLNVQLGTARSKSKAVWFDINGDGLLDFVSEGTLYINNGHTFISESHNWDISDLSNNSSSSLSGGGGISWPNGSFALGVGLSKSKSNTSTAFLDINGDGLEDKIIRSANTYDMLINTGTAFQNNIMNHDFELENKQNSSGFNFNFTICACLGIKLCVSFGYNKDKSVSKQTVDLRDFDGDGLPDLLMSDNEASLKVYHNNLGKANLLSTITNPLQGNISLEYDIHNGSNSGNLIGGTYQMPFSKMALTKVIISDLANISTDGPGIPIPINKSQVTFEYENGVQDRRERAFLGFGLVKTITYGGEEGQPFTQHQTHVTEYETNFNDSDFYVNYNDTRVRQYFYKKGLIRSTYLIDGNGKKRSETKYTYRYFDQLSNIGYELSEGQSQPQYRDIGRIIPLLYKTESTITEFAGNTSHSKTLISTVDQYDQYGNPSKYTDKGSTLTNTGDDIIVRIGYHDPGAKNVVGIPSEHNILAGSITRTTISTVNANRNITKISRIISGQTAETDMEYDIYGNLTKITEPASNNGQRFSKAYTYESTYNTYPVEIRDSYDLASFTQYDANYLLGVPTVITDPNGVSSYYSYDSFGRVTQYRSPVDTDWTIKFYYYPNELVPVAVTERKAPVINGNAPSVNYFSSLFTNRWGQELAAKKLFKRKLNKYSFASNIFQVKDYLGRPVKTIIRDKVTTVTTAANIINALKTYDKYTVGENLSAQVYLTTTYDELDRPRLSTQYNAQTNNGVENLVTENKYGFGPDRDGITQFMTTTISPLGNTSISYTDERGRITSGRQTDGSQNLWTSNKYDIFSQVTQVKDANNNITTYQYDDWGRNIKTVQPDAGEMNYEYDAAGRVVSSNNAKLIAAGQSVTYEYEYNRISAIKFAPDDFVEYKYGDSGATDYSAGRLTSQTDRTGLQTFKYTSLGQVKEHTRILVAPNNTPKQFKTSFVYDVYNRINKITYPDSEEVFYNYNETGLLNNMYSKAPVNQPLVPIVSNIEYDNRDQMVSFTAGNQTQSNYNYDPWGKLSELTLFNIATGSTIRNNQYIFDRNGNILNALGTTPMAHSLPLDPMTAYSHKTYQYDMFNRLKNSKINTVGNEYSQYYELDMTYNNAGNIERKNYRLKSYQNSMMCQNPGNHGNEARYYYAVPGHPNAVSKIEYKRNYPFNAPMDCGNAVLNSPTDNSEQFTYDPNGNLKLFYLINGEKPDLYRQLFWSERNNLKALGERGVLSHYVYDAGGERVLKSDGISKKMYINGNDPNNTTQMGAYTYYPSGYMVLGAKTMSKHYYIGDQRIATRVGRVPSHRFKINEIKPYNELRSVLEEEIMDISDQAQYPPVIWFQNEDSQGTYVPPANTLSNEPDCEYAMEQLLISLSQDPDKESCYEMFLSMYESTLSGGTSFCSLLDNITLNNPQNCMDGQVLPEITDSEMYWIHPDHLGSSSVLTNSNSKVTNWYEYMPFGESLMELSTRDYDNPYKYNGKELDSQTGLYYYGARYYDPQRSFWLSVDPLVEITMSPYAYTWNDPVNYADPTGMIGERIGDPGGPNIFKRVYDWIFGHKPKNGVTVGTITSSREPDLPTFSQAPDHRMPGTVGGAIQDYRDSGPTPGYGTSVGLNMIGKEVSNQILDFGNFIRNSFGGGMDYSGLGPRMTKWDGNTMSATESLNAKFNAVMFADGLMTAGMGAISTRAEAGSINYMKSTDNFARFAARATPQAGALDVIGHGGPNIFQVNNITVEGGEQLINHRVLAKLIRQNPQFIGQDIRLLSCSTGEAEFAQNLANKLKTNVFAPNNILWAHPSGRFSVGTTSSANTGKMIKFMPIKK